MNSFIIKVKGSGSTGCLLNNKLEEDYKNFQMILEDIDVKEMYLSGHFILCLCKNSSLLGWGSFGTNIIYKPIKIHDKVFEVSCGWQHALFLTDQAVKGFGNNSNGQLGLPKAIKYVQNPEIVWKGNVNYFSASFRHSYIISDDKLFGCGQSKKFQLGVAEKKCLEWKCIIESLQKFIPEGLLKIECGKRFILFHSNDSLVYALGYNQKDCFNLKETEILKEPTQLFKEVKKICCGWAHIIILNHNYQVFSYGRNNLGQLGHPQNKQKIDFTLPENQKIEDIFSGSQYSFATTNSGNLYGWGWNQHMNILPNSQKIISTPLLIDKGEQKCRYVWTKPALTIIRLE